MVADDLHLRADDLAGDLEDLLPGEVGVLRREHAGEAVVFAHEEGVQSGQPHLLVGSNVAGDE